MKAAIVKVQGYLDADNRKAAASAKTKNRKG